MKAQIINLLHLLASKRTNYSAKDFTTFKEYRAKLRQSGRMLRQAREMIYFLDLEEGIEGETIKFALLMSDSLALVSQDHGLALRIDCLDGDAREEVCEFACDVIRQWLNANAREREAREAKARQRLGRGIWFAWFRR